ncbi:uncharacterized protein (DUF2062 family) [Evansella vedderi]|uniref:Uncharacterized protein (DUF2062 family) n=1 Tax=Evansella vedderi TaxID=38282 RepID=A0ABT9ZUZ6_9BACI|nr:DUF2062 domain-containing protein [Evansella vedderi]MDQ0254694.1 uncharacterized protein (DUF2062 family) [Evansella vedderi]
MLRKHLRKLKYLIIRLLRIKDKSHGIARGFTFGFLMNFVPTFGFGPFLSTIGPKLVRGNTVAGFIGGMLFLWAFPFMFYLNIVVGESFMPIDIGEKIEEVIIETDEVEAEEVVEVGLKIGKAFIIGMIINIISFGIITYIMIYFIVKNSRKELLKFVHKKWRMKRHP